jgi:hypothetical protein
MPASHLGPVLEWVLESESLLVLESAWEWKLA